eukprot:CAMPEP_0118910294 /NCGR_PEP_ID=MMETSP1166-20130328/12503_1 /TAXON_ID=1104430 /ORGANISM="Chrysoreinhardia sp, Strain CCMP3193" /LENGTH=59 /DNA_ID=CAMNT_0006849755 /DNA_START=43 /DNA_END=218 /DNA_ORIENTATION=+
MASPPRVVTDPSSGVSLLYSTTKALKGDDQFLGAAVLDGTVIGIPGTSREVLTITDDVV